MVKPYLPDIINGVVARVDAAFSLRTDDPFNVFFDKGILPQVRRSVYNADGNFPLVWFVMKYDEIFGTNFSIYCEASFQLIIAIPTDNTYTQQQREDISFKPRLIPIYNQIVKEFKREHWFITIGDNTIKHRRQILPYWGMGDVEGTDQDNLFKGKHIDAISVYFQGLKIRRENCTTGGYPVSDTSVYPISGSKLIQFDDLELIVDAGGEGDPVDGDTTVIIPFLKFKDFTVYQRGTGQLRSKREIEVIPHADGGFSLISGIKFSSGDTYFVKIRPVFIP